MALSHDHQVEAVVINWRRPGNVGEIVRTLKAQSLPCTVTVIDCHDVPEFGLPAEALPYIDRIYRWRHNLGAYSRYVPLAAYDHRYTFFLDDDLLPGRRCLEHFWTQAEQLRSFGALGQLGRIVSGNGEYRAHDVRRGPGFTEVDLLVRAFFVPTSYLTYVPRVRALLGAETDPEDDILLALGLSMQGGVASYLTPADPDPGTLVNLGKLPSPYARCARLDHDDRRTKLLREAMELGWRPLRARRRTGRDTVADRGVLYLAVGEEYRRLARASIGGLRRYGYQGPVRVVTDEAGWLPDQLHCETVLVPGATAGLSARHYKTQLARFGYDLTLFLDADAVPVADVSDIFDAVGSRDLALAADIHPTIGEMLSVNWHRAQWLERMSGEPEYMVRLGLTHRPYFNSGVMVFRRTPEVTRLFEAWHAEWLRFGRVDQMALVRAIALSGTEVSPLPGSWNFQARYFATVQDARAAGVKVLHFLSANRGYLTPELLAAFGDPDRYPEDGEWESWHLDNLGHRVQRPPGAGPGRAPGGGGFLARTAAGDASHVEMVVPAPDGGLLHYWRDVAGPIQSWNRPLAVSPAGGRPSAASLAQDDRGQVELFAQADGRLVRYWREPPPDHPWLGPDVFAEGVTGNPVQVWSGAGEAARGDLLIARTDGGVAHYRRERGWPWECCADFATELGRVHALALTASAAGELHAVLRVGARLAYYYRPAASPGQWKGPDLFFSGATGQPGLIRGDYGQAGALELLTPVRAGGMAHLWLDGDPPGRRWRRAASFGRGGPRVDAVALMTWNGTGRPGDLAAVALSAGTEYWYWRQDRLRGQWLAVSLK